MTEWTPCLECGSDGYILRTTFLGWTAECPKCGAMLSYGVTRTDCLMNYNSTHRRMEA